MKKKRKMNEKITMREKISQNEMNNKHVKTTNTHTHEILPISR